MEAADRHGHRHLTLYLTTRLIFHSSCLGRLNSQECTGQWARKLDGHMSSAYSRREGEIEGGQAGGGAVVERTGNGES